MKVQVKYNSYLNPICEPEQLDTYVVRRAIVGALNGVLPKFKGTLLDVGCGHMPYKELLLSAPSCVQNYIGLDLISRNYNKPDLVWDGKTIPMGNRSVECALATELFEHCAEPQAVMSEIHRILKPGGLLFFTVPFLWPLHDTPCDEYRYTPFALDRLMSTAGYIDVELRALGGWDASLAQLIGLWVRRRPMSSFKRALVSRMALPFVRTLLARDQPPKEFADNCMISGLSGTACKPF